MKISWYFDVSKSDNGYSFGFNVNVNTGVDLDLWRERSWISFSLFLLDRNYQFCLLIDRVKKRDEKVIYPNDTVGVIE